VIWELLGNMAKLRRGPHPRAPLCVNVLIALSLVMLPVLREIPMAVLYGLFLYQAGPCSRPLFTSTGTCVVRDDMTKCV
jgi:hypothetical protein